MTVYNPVAEKSTGMMIPMASWQKDAMMIAIVLKIHAEQQNALARTAVPSNKNMTKWTE